MIVLSQTTDKIQVVLGSAVATNQAECVASWRDITATPTYTPGRSLANTSSTTDVDLVAAPSASTQRIIDYISVYNKDTASITLTIKFDANGTDRILWSGTLLSGEKLEYTSEKGFERYNDAGAKLGVVSLVAWMFFATTFSTAPTFNSSIAGGDVYNYTLNGTTRYRFVPSTYDPEDDAFYSAFSAGTLSGLIVRRG